MVLAPVSLPEIEEVSMKKNACVRACLLYNAGGMSSYYSQCQVDQGEGLNDVEEPTESIEGLHSPVLDPSSADDMTDSLPFERWRFSHVEVAGLVHLTVER